MPNRNLHAGPWWFAGARRAILQSCPSEWAFYNGLGLTVLLVAVMDGLSAESVAADATHTPFPHLWWVGFGWAFVIAALDRLILMQTTSKNGLLGLLLRGQVALAAAALFTIVAMLFVFGPEINEQLQQTNQLAAQRAHTETTRYYQPRIASDQRQITAIEAQQNQLQQEINTNTFLMRCEAGETDCSTSHVLGEGPYYFHYKDLVASESAELASLKNQDAPRNAQLNQNIATLQRQEKQAISTASSAAHNDSGVIARLVALGQITKQHLMIVWGLMLILGLIFIGVDLIPIWIKLKHVWSGESPYEQLLIAERRHEATAAYQRNEETDVKKDCISDQGLADREVNKVRIQEDTDQRIAAMTGLRPDGQGRASSPTRQQSDLVNAYSLEEFNDRIHNQPAHERLAVDVRPDLRRGALVGAALLAGLALVTGLLALLAHVFVGGLWLIALVAVATGLLVVFTRGFRRAPRWGLRAMFAVLLVGMVLPVLIFLFNV